MQIFKQQILHIPPGGKAGLGESRESEKPPHRRHPRAGRETVLPVPSKISRFRMRAESVLRCSERTRTRTRPPQPGQPTGVHSTLPKHATPGLSPAAVSPTPGAPSPAHLGRLPVLLSLFQSSPASPGYLCTLKPASLQLNCPKLAFATCSEGGPPS